ncbi:MAG TPA: hypothetical protein VGL29_03370 [Blastocatellia bacterium]|jgi:hypothetical protein
MRSTLTKLEIALFLLLGINALIFGGQPQESANSVVANIPKAWDDEAVASLEMPLADPRYSPVHVSSDYYYRMPVRPIYKSYPIYAPGKEPSGYMDWLKQQEPEFAFDADKLKTESDWIRAGELVFDAPRGYLPLSNSVLRDPEFYKAANVPLTKDGIVPFRRYVIGKKGVVEIGSNACADCHTRVLPDGSIVKGAQGNFPTLFHNVAFRLRRQAAQADERAKEESLKDLRHQARVRHGAPWIKPDPAEDFMSFDEMVGAYGAVPPGVIVREGTSIRFAAQLPDLIGVKDRRYLDHTGLVRHRSIGDLMRYAALNQDTQLLGRYGDFIPQGKDFRELPDPATQSRYSDEQLYALALYIYSLKPPPNPNKFDALAERGQKVFQSEGCAVCHTPPLYTNNKLTPAEGFKVPEEHRKKYDILPMSVGTDPSSALRTRRGTGYYKVPSLKGVWYRGPFEHNGSVATLEDWFDPRRLRDDYVPTGYKPYGVKTRAVKGHPFGLDLSADDRRALIAFLKTL